MRSEKVYALGLCAIVSLLISPLLGGCSSSNGTSTQATGGTPSSGGTISSGGTSSSGGTASSGGVIGSGGTTASGGVTGSGGSTGSGGASKTGGATGLGGATGSGGSTTAMGGSGNGGSGSGGSGSGGSGKGGSGSGGSGNGGSTGRDGGTGTGGSTGAGGGTVNGGSTGSGGAGGGSSGTCPTVSDFATWTSGKGPADIGKLAVNNFKSHTGDSYGGAGYAWTFTYFGSLQFTKLTGDTATNTTLISGFEPYASGKTAAPDNSSSATVDTRAFGDLPLEIYIENQDARCKTLGLDRADAQWAGAGSDGITKDARYWADDMYMITGLQVFAYRATQDSKYLTRSAKTMIAYIGALQQSNGLFWHTQDSKAHWGRANGWVAAGMTELLLDLPTGSDRTNIMTAYTKMMDGLLAVQISGGTDDGCWRQVLDLTSANAESSCTAMFTYALVNGVKNGWLTDPKYSAAAKKGWVALGNKTNSSGQLSQVCPGTGAAPAGSLSSQQQFYASIALGSNDMHGQAPLLWVAKALLRTDCPGVR